MLDSNQKPAPTTPQEGLRRPAPTPFPAPVPRPPAPDPTGERSRLPLFIGLALIGGFAFGFVISKYGSWTPPKQQSGANDRRVPPQSAPGAPVIPGGPTSAIADFHRVTDVLRADTIKVDGIGPVKMLGIETPDGKEPKSIFGVHGDAALSFAKASLLGKDVRLEFDPANESSGNKDQTGNILAYVYGRDGTLFNGEMIRQGHAFVDVAHSFGKVDQFRASEREAIEGMRGVWGPADSSGVAASQGSGVQSLSVDRGKTDVKGKKLTPILPLDMDSKPGLTSTSPADPVVFVSADDHMYHKDGCPYLGKKKHEMPLSEAKGQGYLPCGRCFASTVLKAP